MLSASAENFAVSRSPDPGAEARMVTDYARRKSPATARLDHLGIRVWKVSGFVAPVSIHAAPARPAYGEEKACGVACRIGVGVRRDLRPGSCPRGPEIASENARFERAAKTGIRQNCS